MAKSVAPRGRIFGIVVALIVILQLVLVWFLATRIYSVWQTKTKSKDSAIIPFKQDTLARPDADLPGFYEPKPDTVNEIEPEWLGKKVVHRINHDGLRDIDNYEVDKPEDVFRIAVMGDSFTYGLFVDDGEVYSEKLEAMLNAPGSCTIPRKVEVINFGVPGYDVEMSAYRYGFRVKNYTPDLVIWYLIENDFNEYASFVQDLWLNIKEMLIAEHIPYERFAPETAEILESVVTGRLGETFVPDHQELKLRDWIKDADVPFVLVSDTTLPKNYQERVRRAIADNPRGQYFDTLTYNNAFAEGHPSPESHDAIARSLFSYLGKHKLLPCTDK